MTLPDLHPVTRPPSPASEAAPPRDSIGLWDAAAHWLRTGAEVLKRPFYRAYERRLIAEAATWNKPQHIGIIMDGNRRFARSRRAPSVSLGHELGARKLEEVLDWCYELEIPVVTVWSFSIDNFRRRAGEVRELLELFESKTRELAKHHDVHRNQVRVRYIGKLDLLPASLQLAIRSVEEATAGYSRFALNVAMAYGGREEITDAFRNFLQDQAERGLSLQEVLERFEPSLIEPYLYTSGQPEPDLIIRTSGEVRLSGFLLWQSAHSEYYFCDTNWPAFRKIDFLRALRSYHERQRRFGR